MEVWSGLESPGTKTQIRADETWQRLWALWAVLFGGLPRFGPMHQVLDEMEHHWPVFIHKGIKLEHIWWRRPSERVINVIRRRDGPSARRPPQV